MIGQSARRIGSKPLCGLGVEPVLGGSILGKLSRRFGEGLVNGALTARVGVAAMEVCRPLPFSDRHKPSVRGMVKRALGGLFSKD